jgi:hypothetical protein
VRNGEVCVGGGGEASAGDPLHSRHATVVSGGGHNVVQGSQGAVVVFNEGSRVGQGLNNARTYTVVAILIAFFVAVTDTLLCSVPRDVLQDASVCVRQLRGCTMQRRAMEPPLTV